MVKYLPAIFFTLSSIFFISSRPFAQGCVGIKNMHCTAMSATEKPDKWQVSLNYRYFRSYKHFVGDVEQKQRVEQGTEVINTVHSADIGVTYNVNSRLAIALTLPVQFNDRSSLYEHYGNTVATNPQLLRFHTHANGLGDIRISGTYWMMEPIKHLKGNFALGFGLKLPTGNSEVYDNFHRRTASGADSLTRKPVDQSIQLGDGGLGFSLESQGFLSIFHNASLYYNGFYLFNPANTNSTLTRGVLAGSDPLIAYFSVPDQFSFRAGMNYNFLEKKNLTAILGGRLEGIPAHDLIGKSEGFRRPGYIFCLEPGVNWKSGKTNLQLSVPVALYRNRTKSVYDLADPAGLRHGDAAFADYLINIGITHSLGK